MMMLLAGCGGLGAPRAQAWPEADRLFHSDPRWLGGDGAHSVDLPGARTLWLFGDSFVAPTAPRSRRTATMVRNSVAVMHGDDPSTASLAFAWRTADAAPQSYFPERDATWFWPADGLVVGDTLSVLLHRIAPAPDDPLGFRIDGFALVRTPLPLAEDPLAWSWQPVPIDGDDPDRFLGVTLLAHGKHIYLFGVRDSARHEVVLARFTQTAFIGGDLRHPDYWGGHADGWHHADAAPIIASGATEFSVGPIPDQPGFALVFSRGFGGTTLAWRTSRALTGPYSDPVDLYHPPESTVARPFVYAGKAHDHLLGADLVATYAANSFDFEALLDDDQLYFPRFVRIDLH